MEMKISHTTLGVMEPSCSLTQEQGVELDYVLPDYYPDVCTMVRCLLTPSVVNESVSADGSRLTYELRADVRILYCSEESRILQCVTQTLHFTRTAELSGGCAGLTAELVPTVDYVTCRAVSRRRLDVRGAVTVAIRTAASRPIEVISDIAEKSMQQKKCDIAHPACTLRTVRNILLAEETALGSTAPPMLHVVRCSASPVETTHQIVSGKLHVQGGLQVQLLYACEKDGEAALEPFAFRIPYSQLVELEGLEEQDACHVHVTAASCDIKPVADTGGAVRSIRCEAELRLHCTAVRMTQQTLVCDAFSTAHPCTCTTVPLKTAGAPVPFTDSLVCTAQLTASEGAPAGVYDAWCEVRGMSARPDEETGMLHISGMLWCGALIRSAEGMPQLLEKEEPVEHSIPMMQCSAQDSVMLYAVPGSCTYTLSEQGEIALKAEVLLEGTVTPCLLCEAVTAVEVQEEAALPARHALKLCYAMEQETVWEIAKRCRTSVAAIMEENDLTEETLPEGGMLLIPIVP